MPAEWEGCPYVDNDQIKYTQKDNDAINTTSNSGITWSDLFTRQDILPRSYS